MRFTKEQKQAIELRGKNILVSAAAGSGKTAVLVERIVRLISEGEHPADIDRLLVVTFTSAAASEMRERIIAAIGEKLAENPENEHLQRQSALIHNAQITTIHSFCLFVIRNHFQEIGLDPAFRVADEGETGLLMQDVLAEVLEESFQKAEEEPEKGAAFWRFVESYSTGKKESVLEESIFSLYRFAVSYPWPEEWLREHGEDYEIHSARELENAPFMRYAFAYLKNILPELTEQLLFCKQLCEEPDGPYMYGENIENSLAGLKRAADAESFYGCGDALAEVCFERLSSKKDESVDAEKREYAKQLRNNVKKQTEQLREQFFRTGEEAALLQCGKVSPVVRELTKVTLRFMERFAERKREKNLIDFSDMEHLALSILCKRVKTEEGYTVEPTAAALELRDYFQEIMTDEYQDSNLVQESILSCISGESAGRYNRFMVGDVKQSIYKFRLARPELFMEKFYAYAGKQDDCCRIDLHQNFRSRREVIESVNFLFSQLLAKNLGGIDYDGDEALHFGAEYYEEAGCDRSEEETVGSHGAGEASSKQEEKTINSGCYDKMNVSGERENPPDSDWRRMAVESTARGRNSTELIFVEASKEEKKSAAEQEADAVAVRIRRLLAENKVLDQESGTLRAAKPKDIVILLRSGSGMEDIFQEALKKQDIPCSVSSRTGYFQASEVQVVLQLLRVLNNPLQDIPLFGVLKSVFGGFGDEELAKLAAAYPGKQKLYQKLERYASGEGTEKESGSKDGDTGKKTEREGPEKSETEFFREDIKADVHLREKCRDFLERYRRLRQCTAWLSIRELLEKIMEESRYLEYVTALPGGAQRRANAEMLLQKADDFEKTSFKGLYHFIRYIDQLEKYSIDYGEAGTLSEAADAVRIMTIHKSKGLEFPVCIVAGMGRKMNRRDASAPVLMDMDMGVAVDLVDPVLRYKQKTLRKTVLAKKILLDSQAEELRILYVALTRAKEKLIITGVTDDVEKELRGKLTVLSRQTAVLPYSLRSGAPRFLDLLTAAAMRSAGMRELLRDYQISAAVCNAEHGKKPGDSIVCKVMTDETIRAGKAEAQSKLINDAEFFKTRLRTGVMNEKMQVYLQEKFGFRYPHENLQGLYAKTTVSELKIAAIRDIAGQNVTELTDREEAAENGKALFEEEMPVPYLPSFLKEEEKEEKISGAARGSAIHRVMELMDFGKWAEYELTETVNKQNERKTSESISASPPVRSREFLEQEIQGWQAAGLLPAEYARAVNRKKILHFMECPLAERMKKAAAAGKLVKEQPFMLGIEASRLSAEFPEDETVLVQGMIDVFFEEADGIVLLDYKTDVIKTMEELAERYRVQLAYYAEALSRITGKRVKERILYSFYLEEEMILG